MTPKQREEMEPWAQLFVRLERRLDAMTDDDLGHFHETLASASQTNCWYAVYRAAAMLKPIVAAKCGERTMRKLKQLDEADEATPPTFK